MITIVYYWSNLHNWQA